MFINDRTFRFQFREVPTVPAVLQATSGARAIGLRHFTLVKFEELNRNSPRHPPQPHAQPAQPTQPVVQPIPWQFAPNHVQYLQNQPPWHNGNQLPQATQGHGWVNILPGPTQPALPTATPQAPNPLAPATYNAQAAIQVQHNLQHQGAIHPLGQQGTQVQGAIQPWFQHQALQALTIGGGPQQTTDQSLGQQNIAQHQLNQAQSSLGGSFQSTLTGQQSFSQNVNHYQSMYGGSHQTTALGGPSVTHNTSQYQSPYGGSFQSTPPGQQNSTQHSSQPHTTGQLTTVQAFNPPAGAVAASVAFAGHTSTAVVLHHNHPQRRALPADDDSDRYFYVNPGSDCVKLQVGTATRYHYPTYVLTQFPQILTPVSDEGRSAYLQHMQQAYTAPTPFPGPGRLPDFLSNIQHLAVNLELAPCHATMRSDGFRIWLQRQTKDFCEVIVKSTIAKFPKLKNLDFLVEGDFTHRANDRMVLRHYKQAPIQEENGINFGHAELGLLEMEIRVWMMSEYMGKHGPEGPEVRIVVLVPQHYSQTKW